VGPKLEKLIAKVAGPKLVDLVFDLPLGVVDRSYRPKLAAAEAIALRDHAAMPLWFWVSPDIVWPYVKGWKANPMDYHRSRWISIDQAARLKQFT